MMNKLNSIEPAAAGAIGASFRRTAADRAIHGAFAGEGMGYDWRMHGKRSKRTHNNHQIYDEE